MCEVLLTRYIEAATPMAMVQTVNSEIARKVIFTASPAMLRAFPTEALPSVSEKLDM